MRLFAGIIILSIAASISTSCSSSSCCMIAPPSINMTGPKTVIERQIVGDYMELEKDAWLISTIQAPGTMSGGAADEELLKAVRKREALADRIAVYKKEGAVGEASTGYAVYRPVNEYEKDSEKKSELLKILEQENSARKEMFSRSLFLSSKKEPSSAEVSAFGRLFAEEQRSRAMKGEAIQEKSGKWSIKK